MAIVSEGTFYKAGIAPSYVSSSGYYGYVPPCPIVNYGNAVVQQQQLSNQHQVLTGNEAINQTPAKLIAAPAIGNGWSSIMLQNHNHQQQQQQQQAHNLMSFNGSAMETDDEETFRSEYVGVSRCQNNHCVIPETAESGTQRAGLYEESLYRVTERENHHARGPEIMSRRGNRKRNSAGDPAYDLFAGQTPGINTKKSRQETVVTATIAMVQETQGNVDRPRCIMSRHH